MSANGKAGAVATTSASRRLAVSKTFKMYIGGAFVRSESGRTFQVTSKGAPPGQTQWPASVGDVAELVNIPQGSKKDVRDAVSAAAGAFDKWQARTAYNRGQILYRLGEVLEARAGELAASLARGGTDPSDGLDEVAQTVDRTVFYAGMADKVASLLASSNPVAGPHFAFSVPEPMGVVGVVAPEWPALLGLVSVLLPPLVTGNTVVVVASAADPRTAIVLAECLATSDVPAGVVNLLTGFAADLAPELARHREVAAVDAYVDDPELRAQIAREGAGSVKRVTTQAPLSREALAGERVGQGLGFVERFVETKSVWHPSGT